MSMKAWSNIRNLKREVGVKVLPEGWERKPSPKSNYWQGALTAPP